MKTFIAFVKKEILEEIRTGKLLILGILFVVFGIMNTAVAKLTPWLLEIMADSLAESGMNIAISEVSAIDSWVQFFKNIPMALIVFIILESNIFTKEYSSGTLVMSLTKGLERYKVVVSKATILCVVWTLGFWLCFVVTYACNALFWDNSIAQNLGFSVACWWLFGIFAVLLTVMFSALTSSYPGVLLGTGGVVLVSYLFGLLPKIGKYFPTYLTGGASLIYGATGAETYVASLVITAVASVACFAVSIPLFNKKQI